MSSPWVKVGIIGGAIVLVATLLLVLKWQHDIMEHQSTIDKSFVEMKQLSDNIARAQARYVTAQDLEKFAKQNNVDLKPIRDDLANLDAQIRGLSVAVVATPGYHGQNLSSSSTTPREGGAPSTTVPCKDGVCPNVDPFGYGSNVQSFAINEPLGDGTNVPFGETKFRAWQDRPWEVRVYPRSYSSTTVLGEDENGKHYTYHKFSIVTNGKTYPVKVTEAKFVEEAPDSSFRFSPRLYLGVDAGTYVNPLPKAEVTPNMQISLFSYGRTKVSPTWTLLGIGLGYESQASRLGVIVSPVNYNVGKHLPLVENLFVGPSVSVDTEGSFAVMGGLRVGL